MEVFPLDGLLPANELLPDFDFPCSTRPSQAGNWLAADKYQVSLILSDQLGQPQVMIVVNKIIP